MADGQIRGSVADLRSRIEATIRMLKHANGEYAEMLEQNLRIYRMDLERAIALTAGATLCGHCEQAVSEGETMHAVCRRTGE